MTKNCPVFVPLGAACGAYSIRPYDWVRAILQNTDAISQLGTCGPSKNCPVFVPYGAACGAYSIRLYNRVRAILRNTDAILQPDTCDPMKYRYNSPTGYVLPFEKLSRFRPLRGRLWGVFNAPL